MTTYIVTLKATGAEVYRYGADAPVEWSGMEFATHDHAAIADAPVGVDPAPTPTQVRISRLAFLSRFTDTEAVGIDLASQGATVQAASMRRYTNKVNAAEFIDLNRPDTRVGVQTLEAVGLIGAGRAAAILDTPPTDQEVWNG